MDVKNKKLLKSILLILILLIKQLKIFFLLVVSLFTIKLTSIELTTIKNYISIDQNIWISDLDIPFYFYVFDITDLSLRIC